MSESTQPTQAPAAAEFDIEGQRQAVESFLIDLLAAFGRSDAAVTVTVSDDEAIEASVDGAELELLAGQKGDPPGGPGVGGAWCSAASWARRMHGCASTSPAIAPAARSLERFAWEVAESVKTSGVAKALDPTASADRKVVHDAVNEIEGVSTASEGEDAARRVVIRPA